MANTEDEYVANYRDGTLTLYAGAGDACKLVVPLEQGNVQITGLSGDQAAGTSVISRGRRIAYRATEESEASISFTSWLAGLSSNYKQNVIDFLSGTGKYAGNTWSTALAHDAKLVDAQWDINTPRGPEYIKVYAVKFTFDLAEADADTISMSGTILKPTLTERYGST